MQLQQLLTRVDRVDHTESYCILVTKSFHKEHSMPKEMSNATFIIIMGAQTISCSITMHLFRGVLSFTTNPPKIGVVFNAEQHQTAVIGLLKQVGVGQQ